MCFFFFQAEDGIRDGHVTGVQTCALPILIFLMMAAHDTSTSAITTMIYQLAAHPEWQQRCRDESARLGDGPLDIEALEKLESLELGMKESLLMDTRMNFVMRQSVRDTDLMTHYLAAGTNA